MTTFLANREARQFDDEMTPDDSELNPEVDPPPIDEDVNTTIF